MSLVATIGLEIHAELKTTTKMFCRSLNDSSETRPNTNICPVCLAHPGALPVINKQAVHHVLRVGKALGAKLADYTEFDRKNYFYPDLPKGYQISQYEYPLVSGGVLKDVAITRVHLEEDTASSIHDEKTGETHIDYNRGGVPLMELVTEPVITSAEQAGAFARELQLLLRYLGVSDANMEKGEMRVEANISVAEAGKRSKNYVEVKNLNSFRIMERAIAYEIQRQSEVVASGGEVQRETRGWNDVKQQTFSQRVKETSADYRYFPDPDLPSLRISEIPEFADAALSASLPELPEARRARYRALQLKPIVVEQFVTYPNLGTFFDDVSKDSSERMIALSANYIANDLVSVMRGADQKETESGMLIPITTERFKKIMQLIEAGRVSSRVAKDLLQATITEDKDPEVLATERQLFQDTSLDLTPVIGKVLEAHPQVVADFKGGKAAALQFLVGQCMRELRGAVDPGTLREKLIEALA